MANFPKDLYNREMIEPGASVKTNFVEGNVARGTTNKVCVIIGPSKSGIPANAITQFSDIPKFRKGEIATIKDLYGTDSLITNCFNHMWNPSKDPDVRGAYDIYHVRPEQATQASWQLDDAGAEDALLGTSRDYGTPVNALRLRVENPGDNYGTYNLYTKKDRDTATYASIGRGIIVGYTGSGTLCTMQIINEYTAGNEYYGYAIQLKTTKDGAEDLNIDLTATDFNTLGSLLSYINAQTDYVAMLDNFTDSAMYSRYLDPTLASGSAASVSVKQVTGTIDTIGATTISVAGTPWTTNLFAGMTVYPDQDGDVYYTILSNTTSTLTLQSDAAASTYADPGDTLKIYGYVTKANIYGAVWAARNDGEIIFTKAANAIGASAAASNFDAPTDTTGYIPPTSVGTAPDPTASDYLTALGILRTYLDSNGGFIQSLSTSATVQASFGSFATERTEASTARWNHFCGLTAFQSSDASETPTDYLNRASSRALYLYNKHTVFAFPGIRDYNSDDVLTTRNSVEYAAQLCGQAAGTGLEEPLTNNQIRIVEPEIEYDLPDRETLIKAGVTTYKKELIEGRAFYRTSLAQTTASGGDRGEKILFVKMAIDDIDMYIKQSLEATYKGKKVRANLANEAADYVFFLLGVKQKEELLIADPSDPGNYPAFTYPSVTYAGGVLTVNWNGTVTDEVEYIKINGNVKAVILQSQ